MAYRTMISADEARDLVLGHAVPRDPHELAAADALGLVLAEEVRADRDFPPFDRATMDGFAVRVDHAGREVHIGGEARPGIAPSAGVTAEACVEIMTGAPCPPGTEAVVMKEEVTRRGDVTTFPLTIHRGQNIVGRAKERARGAVVLPTGARVTPMAAALLATVGRQRVQARRRPSVALLVTGDELRGAGEGVNDAQIRDANGPMLAAILSSASEDVVKTLHVGDTAEALAVALETVASADVVVLTGGVSAGNYDLVPAALATHGATIVFHKVRQQPGKPMIFATLGRRLFFGLPGTPLGCHLCCERYVVPALRSLAGISALRATERGVLRAAWTSPSDRQQFVLALVSRDADTWRVTPLSKVGSSDVFAVWSANAYMLVPEGTRALPPGGEVAFEWLSGSP